MLISEFIKQLQNIYDEEGDMEIAIKVDGNDLGSEPIVVKSTVYVEFSRIGRQIIHQTEFKRLKQKNYGRIQ